MRSRKRFCLRGTCDVGRGILGGFCVCRESGFRGFLGGFLCLVAALNALSSTNENWLFSVF